MALAGLAGGFAESGGAAARGPASSRASASSTLTVVGPKMLVTATDAGCAPLSSSESGAPTCRSEIALSLVLATALLEPIGWRGLWFLNSGLILLFVLVFLWGAAPGRWQAPAVRGGSFDGAGVRATLARPGPWLFGASFAIFAVEWQALMAWLPTFLIETQASELAGAALFTALFVLVTALGSVACAGLIQRGRRALAAAGNYLRRHGSLRGGALRAVHARRCQDRARPLFRPGQRSPCPPSVSKGGIAHASSPAQVAMAGGFVAQGAALGAVLGPPPARRRDRGTGAVWEAAWWDHAGLVLPRSRGRRRGVAGRYASRALGGCGAMSGRSLARAVAATVIACGVGARIRRGRSAPPSRFPRGRSPSIRQIMPGTVSATCSSSAGWISEATSRHSAGCRGPERHSRRAGLPPSPTAATGSPPASCATTTAASWAWPTARSGRSGTPTAGRWEGGVGATPRRWSAWPAATGS